MVRIVSVYLVLCALAVSAVIAGTTDPLEDLQDWLNTFANGDRKRLLHRQVHAVDLGGEHGYGLVATGNIGLGETLMRVPKKATLSIETLPEPTLPPRAKTHWDNLHLTSPNDVLALKLLLETAKGADSSFALYLSLLPEAVPLPVFLDDLSDLKGSPLHDTVRIQQRLDDTNWKAIYNNIIAHAPAVFPEHIFTKDKYQHALALISSRAFTDVNTHAPIMVPLMDMANHNFTDSAKWEQDPSTGDFILSAAVTGYSAGDEITIQYNLLSSSDFLLKYGFAIDNNPFDYVAVHVDSKHMIEPGTLRERLLSDRGFLTSDGTSEIEVFLYRGDPLNARVLSALRVLILDEEQLKEITENGHSDSLDTAAAACDGAIEDASHGVGHADSETAKDAANHVHSRHEACALDVLTHPPFTRGHNGLSALNLLLAAVITRLSEYPTSVEADTRLLQESFLSPSQRAVFQMRRAEKRILHLSLARIRHWKEELIHFFDHDTTPTDQPSEGDTGDTKTEL